MSHVLANSDLNIAAALAAVGMLGLGNITTKTTKTAD